MFIAEKAAELIEKHRQEFMKRAFSVRTLAADVPLTTASASIIDAAATSSKQNYSFLNIYNDVYENS